MATGEPTLAQLARLRAEAVERAARALAEAERAREACAELCARARASWESRRDELASARAQFAGARTVMSLRCASAATERALSTRETARAALVRAEQRLASAEREVETHARLVRDRELARRAIGRTLGIRAQAATLRTERRLEDELDDAFRTRS